MKEQLPYYEDRQQEAWEDYQNLEQQREDLHRQCLEQSLTISEANERIKELENQLSPLSSATPSYVAGLEAERDEWKKRCEEEGAEVGRLFSEYKNLNARHAALVEAASKVCLCRMYYSKRGVNPALDEYQAMMQSITELADIVKAALEEVGG